VRRDRQRYTSEPRFHGHAKVRGDLCDFRFLNRHHGMPATLCASSAIHLLLNIAGQDLKWLLVDVMR
jgi:hypothetical protein